MSCCLIIQKKKTKKNIFNLFDICRKTGSAQNAYEFDITQHSLSKETVYRKEVDKYLSKQKLI